MRSFKSLLEQLKRVAGYSVEELEYTAQFSKNAVETKEIAKDLKDVVDELDVTFKNQRWLFQSNDDFTETSLSLDCRPYNRTRGVDGKPFTYKLVFEASSFEKAKQLIETLRFGGGALPKDLDFHIEERVGLQILVANDESWCRPASDAEVQLWNSVKRT